MYGECYNLLHFNSQDSIKRKPSREINYLSSGLFSFTFCTLQTSLLMDVDRPCFFLNPYPSCNSKIFPRTFIHDTLLLFLFELLFFGDSNFLKYLWLYLSENRSEYPTLRTFAVRRFPVLFPGMFSMLTWYMPHFNGIFSEQKIL